MQREDLKLSLFDVILFIIRKPQIKNSQRWEKEIFQDTMTEIMKL